MKKLHFSILINAPKEKVWHAMLDDRPYREWAAAFNPGSYYKGSWEKGSKILFLGPDPNMQEEGGMVSRIAENRRYEFISIEHKGLVRGGVEDTTSAEARKWAPAFENYTLRENNKGTEVLVDLDVADEYADMFDEMWRRGLEELKKVAERQITVKAVVNAPLEKVWEYWNNPKHIIRWAFASDDWEAPAAENDIRVGGNFKTTMAAKNKSASFDFTGTYIAVKPNELIEYKMSDGRRVKVEFSALSIDTVITETFDPETSNPEDMQKAGWQAILDNFKKHTENN